MTATTLMAPSATFTEDELRDLTEKILRFCEQFCASPLFPYQQRFARRIIRSLLNDDGDELTALMSRQSGKTQVLAVVLAGCMVLLPKLANTEAFEHTLTKFRKGLMVGCFAPVTEQAETLHSRIKDFLTSDHAKEIYKDPEIDEEVKGKGTLVSLRSGSLCRRQTANPRANIESKSYHVVVVDECQDTDTGTVDKSIRPMLAAYNGTICMTGTASRTKGVFYEVIKRNIRRDIDEPDIQQNHFQFDWKECAKYNRNYEKFVRKELERLGEDSDEFQLSYELRWLLDRGMFITEQRFDHLTDPTMPLVSSWHKTPIVVGVDPARVMDSTVVTAVWVDWENPDEYGFHHHRVLDWLEIIGEDWEEQYFKIAAFCANYDVYGLGVDQGGVGDAVAQRLSRLMPRTEIVPLTSSHQAQSKRWTHLRELTQRQMVSWPGSPEARKERRWKRFKQQMTDLELDFKGPYMLAAAPEEAHAHDDYADSLAIACALTADLVMPEVQMSTNVFYR